MANLVRRRLPNGAYGEGWTPEEDQALAICAAEYRAGGTREQLLEQFASLSGHQRTAASVLCRLSRLRRRDGVQPAPGLYGILAHQAPGDAADVGGRDPANLSRQYQAWSKESDDALRAAATAWVPGVGAAEFCAGLARATGATRSISAYASRLRVLRVAGLAVSDDLLGLLGRAYRATPASRRAAPRPDPAVAAPAAQFSMRRDAPAPAPAEKPRARTAPRAAHDDPAAHVFALQDAGMLTAEQAIAMLRKRAGL